MTNVAPSDDAVSSDGNTAGSKASPRTSDTQGLGIVIAVLLLLIVPFVVLVTIDTSVNWSSLVLIFGPIETLAAATLGWYFGSAIQRERVAQAEAHALQDARDAENGRALAALVLSREGRVVENDAGATLVETETNDDQKLRREYADAARLLFPYSLSRTKPTDESNQGA